MKQFILGLIAMKVGGDLWLSVRRKLKYRKMDREIAAYYANGGDAFVNGWEGWVEDAPEPTPPLVQLMSAPVLEDGGDGTR